MVIKGLQKGLPGQFQWKGLYFIKHFIKAHHTPKVITLTISVIDASYL